MLTSLGKKIYYDCYTQHAQSFSFGGGLGGVGLLGILLFSMCSHRVPSVFPLKLPMGSQPVSQVLNLFLNMFPIARQFVPYALPNIVPF